MSISCMTESDMEDWPALPGVYALVLEVNEPLEIQVRQLGRFELAPGRYAYVGSAHGSGGLRARLARHLRPVKRLHWHIDTLTAVLPVSAVLAVADPRPLECTWVRRLLATPGAGVPITRFGSSDCRAGCPAHLIRLPAGFNWENWGNDEER